MTTDPWRKPTDTDASDRALHLTAEILGSSVPALDGRALHELGGSSLDASRIAHVLRRRVGASLTSAELIATPDLARTVRSASLHRGVREQETLSGGLLASRVPLTWQQRLVWYQGLLDPTSPRYHFHALFHFEDVPEQAALRTELQKLLDRHRALATRLTYSDGEISQQVPLSALPEDFARLTVVRLDSDPASPEALIAATDANRPFDLDSGPLIRWTLVVRPHNRATLIHTEHHLVHDGVSFNLILEDLVDIPRSERDERYFHHAQRQAIPDVVRVTAAVEECRNIVDDLFPQLDVPSADADHFLRLEVPTKLAGAVADVARIQGVSVFTVLFSAFSTALAKVRSAHRFAVGTAVANRPADMHDVVGMFVSTTPVIVEHKAGQSPVQSVRNTELALQRAVARADIPLPDLIAALGSAARGTDRGLVQAAFSMHEYRTSNVSVAGKEATVELGTFNGAAKFPVNGIVLMDRSSASPAVTLLLEGSRFHVGEGDLWILWRNFIEGIRELTGVTPEGPPDVEPLDVVAEVAKTVTCNGSLIALEDDEERISYGELEDLGTALALRLNAAGSVVGLLGSASARFFACAYAALHAGATYVPLDSKRYPGQIADLVRQTGCDIVVDLNDSASAVLPAQPNATDPSFPSIVSWPELRGAVPDAPHDQAAGGARSPRGDQPAYFMFTSGSTGVPKAVSVSRRSLGYLCTWARQELGLEQGTVVSQAANIGFDASVWEVWPALCAGSLVRVVPEKLRSDPYTLADWLTEHRVEVAFAPAPVAQLLTELEWAPESTLRILGAGGDRLHQIRNQGLPFTVINLYGPTECTVVATAHRLVPEDQGPPPIGRALPHVYIRVVDVRGTPVPPGESGELWIGGECVANGYVNQERETMTRFTPDPYSASGRLLYRTGDLVRQRADGALEYLGRRDRQVKVSGVRIELAELEAIALAQQWVRQAVAIADGERGRQRLRLVLALAPGSDETAVSHQIRAAMPQYLRHLTLTFLPELPISPNGKVNLNVLAASDTPAPPTANLLTLAQEMIGVTRLDAAWFELGGSSLVAAKLVSIATREHALDITLKDLLNASSVEKYLQQRQQPNGHAAETNQGQVFSDGQTVEPIFSAVSLVWPMLERLSVTDKLEVAKRLVSAAVKEVSC